MPARQIEEFAKILVQEVRDAAIRDCDIIRRPDSPAGPAKQWRKLIRCNPDPDFVAAQLIPECVDMALFFLLKAIDDETLRLRFVTEDGQVIDLNSEGLSELAGWYAGFDGWSGKYSRERLSELDADDDSTDPSKPL